MANRKRNSVVTVLGPLTQQFLAGATWKGKDAFPGRQVEANDVECVLTFLQREKRLAAFFTIAKKQRDPRMRDDLLAEVRSAYFLAINGFRIVDWCPRGRGTKEGEFTISLGSSPNIFVEVKSPGWQGEVQRMIVGTPNLTPHNDQRLRDRRNKPKFIPGAVEGYAVAPHLNCMNVVRRNVIPKLMDDRPNLAVVMDNCWVTAVGLPSLSADVLEEFLHPCYDKDDPSDTHNYDRLGGVLFLNPNWGSDQNGESVIDYSVAWVRNPNVLTPCSIPREVSMLFSSLQEESERRDEPKWIGG